MAKHKSAPKQTPATLALEAAGVEYELKPYEFEHVGGHIAEHAAETVGEDPERVFKTLMLLVDGKPACAVIESAEELNMKKVAAAFGGKSAEMMNPTDAERITGYHVGGISPFGQRKKVRTAISEYAQLQDYVLINGGGRGLMAKMTPDGAIKALDAIVADLTR